MSESPTTADLMSGFVMGNYGRFPVSFTHGEGSRIWDENGKRYLDFGMGIAVCSLGHCHPAQQRAISEQSGKLIHCSNLYHIRGQAANPVHIAIPHSRSVFDAPPKAVVLPAQNPL